MRLEKWGAGKEENQIASDNPEYVLGRVVSQEREVYRVVTEQEDYFARVSGKYRYDAVNPSDYPVVGDFVLMECMSREEPAIIQKVLPRKSAFMRKAAGTTNVEQIVASNVDTIFLCMSLNKDFNVRRLERYLSVAWDSGATPVIVLTKKDLSNDVEDKLLEIENIAIGVPVIETSAIREDGLNQIYPYLKEHRTVAFVGSSGVGKSTLINRLLGKELIETGGLRNDDKGRHTTTHRELFMVPGRGMVIDTPGMRELGMWSVQEGIDHTFSDIDELVGKCRFNNCTHQTEPGCAVRQAVEDGLIAEERYRAYMKLKAENAYNENAADYLAAKKKKFKEIAKLNKNHHRQ